MRMVSKNSRNCPVSVFDFWVRFPIESVSSYNQIYLIRSLRIFIINK